MSSMIHRPIYGHLLEEEAPMAREEREMTDLPIHSLVSTYDLAPMHPSTLTFARADAPWTLNPQS
jgi:hypothetical protein